MVPQLEVPSKQPDSAALLLWQQPISTTTFTVLQLGSVLFRLLQFLALINIGQSFTVRVSHLTRGSVSILLCVDLVVLGNFDPLVGLHAGLTQPFSALHTKAYGSCVVLAACAHLEKITRISKITRLIVFPESLLCWMIHLLQMCAQIIKWCCLDMNRVL